MSRVVRGSKQWKYAVDKIVAAEKASKDHDEFKKKMVLRLRRIRQIEKIYYAIEVLKERGHQDIVDIYEGKLLMERLTKNIDRI